MAVAPKMKPKPNWKQKTPRSQLVALISAAQGDLLNVTSGIIPNGLIVDKVDRAEKFLEDAQEILKAMPPGEWEQ